MPSRKIEEQLETLKSLRGFPANAQTISALRKALSDRVNIVIAKAATIVAELQLKVLIPDLLTAFDRLFTEPVKADPQCWGKNAAAAALKDLGHDKSSAFLRGARHVQMEPVWGDEVDTAGTLRATCALALVQCADLTREDKLWHEMRALTDTEPTVRADAARALEQLDGVEAALLLRLKARMQDAPAVMGQVLESLLAIEGESAVPFVAEFLGARDPEIRDEAALSLGASRLSGAIVALMNAWKRSRSLEAGEVILRSLSASRQESALEFLLEMVRIGREHEALAALQALELQRDSQEIRKRIGEAIQNRTEHAIAERFRRSFPIT